MGRAGMKIMVRILLVVSLSAGLSACSWFDDDEYVDPYAGRSALSIYQEAEAELNDGDAETAGEIFTELERVHPYSEWAKRAMILGAYSFYQAGLYERSRESARRFLDFYPADKDSAYAQYLIALGYYDQIVDVERDQATTRAALRELTLVTQRYPDSDYAREATLRIDLTRDQLAGKEMMIGRYYLGRGQNIAAINRFKVVLSQFQTTSHTPEALHRLVEAYLSLGVESEARTAAAVLGHNFPGSDWYQASFAMMQGANLAPFEDEESWISRVFRRITSGATL